MIGGIVVAIVVIVDWLRWLAPKPIDAIIDLLNAWRRPAAIICSEPTSSAATASAG